MTYYVVVKTFDTLAEADRFAESVTEDDIVGVFPLDGEPAATLRSAGFSSSGRYLQNGRRTQQPPDSPRPPAPIIQLDDRRIGCGNLRPW